MKYRLSFLFALLRQTIIPTTKAERATETPSIIQAIFAVSFLAIGEPPVGSFWLMKPPDVGSLLLVRCCLVTEGKKQSLMLRTVTVIHIIEKVALMFK